MQKTYSRLLTGGLLIVASTLALAQTQTQTSADKPETAQSTTSSPHEGAMMHHEDGGFMHHMQLREKWMVHKVEHHLESLKKKLALTPAQQESWNSFHKSMMDSLPKSDHVRPNREEISKLSTPERLDRMKEERKKHMAEADARINTRDEAIKTFYSGLSAEQKKTFDAAHEHFYRK